MNDIDRYNQMVHLRREGQTLDQIGTQFGVSRERVRQVIGDRVSSEQAKAASHAAQAAKVNDALTAPMNLDDLAALVDMSVPVVSALIAEDRRHLVLSEKSAIHRQYSDDDLLNILRAAADQIDGPVTGKAYLELRDADPTFGPTVAVFHARFGSWVEANKRAGVSAGATMRQTYPRRHSNEQMHEFVREFLTTGERTAEKYDEWQRGIPGAPSLALLRQRLGRWNEIKRTALTS